MANVTPSLHQPKSREREGFKEDGRETEPVVLPRLRSKGKRDWQKEESETRLEEQLRLKNRGKHVFKVGVKGGIQKLMSKDKQGFCC